MYKQIESGKFKVITFLIQEHNIKPSQIIEIKASQIKPSGIQMTDRMIIPMPEDVVKALGDYVRTSIDKIKASGFLFPSRKPGEQWTVDHLLNGLKPQLKKIERSLADLGLKAPPVNKKIELKSLEDIISFLNQTEQSA